MATFYRKSDIPEHLLRFFAPAEFGLEPTPDAYVARMVEVFREVRRVLRSDGVLLLNVGDSYATDQKGSGGKTAKQSTNAGSFHNTWRTMPRIRHGCKPKDLIGIPWLLAFALRADGWWLRQDLIWSKPNPMPESVTDRCTKSHEYLFLLAKSERYFWDAEAIKEASATAPHAPRNTAKRFDKSGTNSWKSDRMDSVWGADGTRNRRSVWTISTRAFRGAHFATFPPDLVQPCIAAGSSERGCCPACGSPWERVVERTPMVIDRSSRTHERGRTRSSGTMVEPPTSLTTGWRPACTCPKRDPIPCTILDPFSGSGTTGAVARVMGRAYVGTELNPDYAAMWDARLADVQKWWAKRGGKPAPKRAKAKMVKDDGPYLFNVA